MDEKQKSLIKESKKEDSFSSHIHNIELNKKIIIEEDYQIPQRYNKNRLVLLPVNTTKYYFYWEFTDSLFKYEDKTLKELELRVLNQNKDILLSFKTCEQVGEYFFINESNDKNIYVEAGFFDNENYISLLTTNKVKPISKEITFTTIENEMWLTKNSSFSQIVKSSLDPNVIGMSSLEYMKELKRIQDFIEKNTQNFSSKDLIKDEK